MKVVRLSALHSDRLYPPGDILVLIFRGWVDPRAVVRTEGFNSMKNRKDPIGNRTHDILICSAVFRKDVTRQKSWRIVNTFCMYYSSDFVLYIAWLPQPVAVLTGVARTQICVTLSVWLVCTRYTHGRRSAHYQRLIMQTVEGRVTGLETSRRSPVCSRVTTAEGRENSRLGFVSGQDSFRAYITVL